MKVLGLIVEYNPFHNGHKYHIQQAKKIVNPDYTVAVMSGNFVQRGEPAIIDKYARTEIALQNGIDLLLELPFVYSIQDAGGFALGSIGTLHRSKVVTDIIFGSESGDIEIMNEIAHILLYQPGKFKKYIKYHLKEGHSYPNARKKALYDYFEKDDKKDIIYKIIEKSNDILGIEYLKNSKLYNTNIHLNCIKRKSADYNEENYTGEISSATAIRKIILDENYKLLEKTIPETSYQKILQEINDGKGPINYENMRDIILYKTRITPKEELIKIYGVKEGLEKRIIESAQRSSDLSELLANIKTKRFTYTRIKRTILNIIFDITDEKIQKFNEYGPQYIRVLGFNKKGKELLNQMKNKVKLPIITTPSRYIKILNEIRKKELSEDIIVHSDMFLEQFNYDIKASEIYSLLYQNKENSKKYNELTRQIIIK
ncbi:MAG: hypothetical protein PWP28_2547 [Oceanotoga sp.]|uniref:nucleotidyltransferase n=1 Tax=Oceanotoga sp. TaxID=2108366 RepID=UPI00264F7FF0|nr:nucleotidyltransferase [Oceanotoga sp.]MDN5343667.1 hypothetical protein [Oceanotoga sp.]